MRQAWKTWILKSRKIPESCLEKFKTKKIQHYFVSRPEDGWNKRSNMSNKRKLKKLRKLRNFLYHVPLDLAEFKNTGNVYY
jgi:hypothetical protein